MKYYFLSSYLPEIHRDDLKIRVSLGEMLEERFHIAERDWQEIELVLLGRDVFIIERLLSGKPVSMTHSLFGVDFWREQIKSPKDGPDFLLTFLLGTDLRNFGPREVDKLYGAYFEHVFSSTRNDFIRGYFTFQQDLRNVLAAMRARQKGLDPSEHVIGEGEVVKRLTGSTAEDFGLGGEYPWLEHLIKAEAPHERQEVIDRFLWEYLDENEGPDPFDFRAILAYLLKLELLHNRLALSEEKGMEKVRRLGGF